MAAESLYKNITRVNTYSFLTTSLATQETKMATWLHDFYYLDKLVIMFSGGHEAFQHQYLEIFKHITV